MIKFAMSELPFIVEDNKYQVDQMFFLDSLGSTGKTYVQNTFIGKLY